MDADTKKGVAWLTVVGMITIGCKLAGVIDWSWLWITLPLWIVPAGIASVFVVALPFAIADKIGARDIHRPK